MRNPRLWALAALLVAACDPPTDLGKLCALHTADGGEWDATSTTDDYYDNGTTECQNLVCLRPAGSPLDAGSGICSSNCSPETPGDPDSHSDDCNGSSIPLVCRTVALDPAFISALESQPNGTQLLIEYLGGTTPPVFCTTPQ